MQPLITLQEYRTLTNTTSGSDDSLISSLLSAASLQIEAFCNRPFWKDTYIQWIMSDCSGWEFCGNKKRIYPENNPVIAILYHGVAQTALTVSNSGTDSYTFNINDGNLFVTNKLNYTSYDLNAINTLANLATAVEDDYSDLNITVNANVTDDTILIKPHTYTIMANESVDMVGSEQSSGNSYIQNQYTIIGAGTFDVLAYLAGYDVIPEDLKRITANITRDYNTVQTQNKQSLKSESITNYSYTLSDNINWYDIVNAYQMELSPYKNVII